MKSPLPAARVTEEDPADAWIALLIPVAVALHAAAALFGGRAARPMLIAAFVLAVFAICLVLVAHAT